MKNIFKDRFFDFDKFKKYFIVIITVFILNIIFINSSQIISTKNVFKIEESTIDKPTRYYKESINIDFSEKTGLKKSSKLIPIVKCNSVFDLIDEVSDNVKNTKEFLCEDSVNVIYYNEIKKTATSAKENFEIFKKFLKSKEYEQANDFLRYGNLNLIKFEIKTKNKKNLDNEIKKYIKKIFGINYTKGLLISDYQEEIDLLGNEKNKIENINDKFGIITIDIVSKTIIKNYLPFIILIMFDIVFFYISIFLVTIKTLDFDSIKLKIK